MKLVLINAGLPADQQACLRTHAYAPLGIVHLATYLKSRIPDLSLVLIDDQISGLATDLPLADVTLLGISANSLTYPRAVEIAECLKARGLSAPIVLGGIHATALPRQILRNRTCFDYAVTGQGYEPLLGLVLKSPPAEVPNLSYRTGDGEIRSTFQRFLSIEDLPTPDFSFLSLAPYFANFQRHYANKSQLKAVPFMSSTGCEWRLTTGGCTFCSIPNVPSTRFTPNRFWREVSSIERLTAADFFWDVSDTFTSDPDWVADLGVSRPASTRATFHVYARATDFARADLVSHLVRVGVREVLLGVESFDEQMLCAANKGTSPRQLFSAIEALSEAGIRIAVSLILGLPGETQRSLRASLQGCSDLKQRLAVSEMHASIITLLPGSKLYRQLLSDPEMAARYGSMDTIPHERILEEYLTRFTRCSMADLVETYLKMDVTV